MPLPLLPAVPLVVKLAVGGAAAASAAYAAKKARDKLKNAEEEARQEQERAAKAARAQQKKRRARERLIESRNKEAIALTGRYGKPMSKRHKSMRTASPEPMITYLKSWYRNRCEELYAPVNDLEQEIQDVEEHLKMLQRLQK